MKVKRVKDGDEARLTRRYGWGCLVLFVLLPLLGVGLVFYVGDLHLKEWEEARPSEFSDKDWEAHRALCETASLSATECGATSRTEVAKLSEAAMRKFCAEDARSEAISQAKDAVLAHLKSPSSANFVASSIGASQAACDWTVTGRVDAQNSFGAMVRSPFKVQIRRASKSVWIPWSVRVD